MGRDRKLEWVPTFLSGHCSFSMRATIRLILSLGLPSSIGCLSGLSQRYHVDRPIPSDSDDDASTFNHELSILSTTTPNPTDTWFTAPWLFAECYLYRLIRSFFAQKGNSKRWLEFDPFFESKKETYRQSSVAIVRESTWIARQRVACYRADGRSCSAFTPMPDLAKSLKALESKREALLAEGWQAPGSALEIVFLCVQERRLIYCARTSFTDANDPRCCFCCLSC